MSLWNLGAYFRKYQKNKQRIEVQKAAKVSKYSRDFDILNAQTLRGSLPAVSKPIFAT